MCIWPGVIDARLETPINVQPDTQAIGERLQAGFGVEQQGLSDEMTALLQCLRQAERLSRIRAGF